MPRHSIRERTIYNGNAAGDRLTNIKPALGDSKTSRSEILVGNTEEENTSTKPAEKLQQQRDESLIKIRKITSNQTDILFKTATLFPFDIFPDIVRISSTKIEIKSYSFFFTYQTISIPLQDIGFIQLDMALFLATLTIINIRSEKPVIIRYLWHKDAKKMQRIINGLLVAQEAGVDVSVIEPKKLIDQIESIGE